MAGTSYIYQFGEDCDPPYIQTDAEYLADSMRTQGWQTGIVRQEFLNKVDRQGNSIAAGLAAFMAAYESGTVDVKDDLSPAALSNILLDAISHAPLTTQPQFDNSTKAATTAFVQRALGNFSDSVAITANTVLSASYVGKVIYVGAGSINIALPLLSNVPLGAQITICANSYTNIFIDSQSPDLIANGELGSSLSSLSINGWETITFIKSTAPKWFVTFGDAALNGSSLFKKSLTTNGYQDLPGGQIEQWGQATIAFDSSTATTTITLPQAWPTGFLNGQLSFAGSVPPSVLANTTIEADPANPLTKIKILGYSPSTLSEVMFYTVKGH